MGRKNEDSIVGTTVLVEPQPCSESLSRAGELGHVAAISTGKDMIDVVFSDGKLSRYKPHDLLALHSSDIILKGLLKNWQISNNDCRAVLQVVRLLRTGDTENALKCALTSEITKSFCLIRVSSCLNITQQSGTRIKKSRGSTSK